MFKLFKNEISIFLIIIAMLLLLVSSGYCEAKYQFSAAGVNPIWGETGILLQSFAASLRHSTEGEIDIKIFAGEWGGDEIEHCQSVQFGTLDIATPATSNLTQYTNALYMFEVPFLFQNAFDEIAFAFDSNTKYVPAVEKKLAEASEDCKFKVLAVAPLGRRNINSTKPINSISDLKGVKIRVMNSPVQVDTWNFIGANATPMPFSEIFMAMQLGAVDAMEGPPIDYMMEKFYQVAPYHVATDHFALSQGLVMSMKAWNSLPTAYQNIVKDCAVGAAHTASLWGLGSYEYYLGSSIPKVAKSVSVMSDNAELRAMVLPKLLDKYSDQIGMDVLEAVAEGDEVITDWLKK